jgi:hypothetical protein
MPPLFDASTWQAPDNWDWPGFAANADGLIARASYGAGTKDRYFQRYAELVRGTGKLFGSYAFYRQTQEWQRQLDVYMAQLMSVQVGPGDVYPALDLENNVTNGDGEPLKSKFNVDARLMAEALRAEYGKCILYMSAFFPEWLGARADGSGGDAWKWILEDGYLHWIADFSRPAGRPRVPYTPDWHIHQAGPQKTPLYANGTADVDHDYLREGVSLSDLTIPQSTLPGDDTADGDDETAERPGGALPSEWEDAWGMIREGASLIAEGALLMERARDDDDRTP